LDCDRHVKNPSFLRLFRLFRTDTTNNASQQTPRGTACSSILLSTFFTLDFSLPSVFNTFDTPFSHLPHNSPCLNSINYPSQLYSAPHSSLRPPTSPLPSQLPSRQWSVPRFFPCKMVSLNTKVSSPLRLSARSTLVSSTFLHDLVLLSLLQ